MLCSCQQSELYKCNSATFALHCIYYYHLRQIDLDTIETSNLNRQFLFRQKHVGESKAKVAAEAVQRFRPNARIIAHQVRPNSCFYPLALPSIPHFWQAKESRVRAEMWFWLRAM